ncbi:MAG: hypothetical protein LRY71_00330 [Bacillaceae bacterium]|nr:hypothetical protein [Bacillaceae bacterium]
MSLVLYQLKVYSFFTVLSINPVWNEIVELRKRMWDLLFNYWYSESLFSFNWWFLIGTHYYSLVLG